MTEQTAPTGKVAKLTPEEWKQLVLVNTAQLQNYLQAVPGNLETGAAGFTDQHLALVNNHVGRMFAFMRAWSLASVDVPAQQSQAQPEVAAAAVNGAAPRKGGWPKGKKRTPRAPAAEDQQ